MGRADDLRARYDAELAVLVAEDSLIAAKEKGVTGDKLTAIKDELRAARQTFREQREADPPGPGEARPAPAKATATVKKKG